MYFCSQLCDNCHCEGDCPLDGDYKNVRNSEKEKLPQTDSHKAT